METNTYTDIERRVSVKDLLKYLSSKIKLIVVFVAIFTVLFGVLGVVVQSMSAKKEIDVETLKEQLTEQELSDLQYCQSIEAMIRQSLDYYENSLLLNSDLNNIAQGEIVFYAKTENTELSNDVVNMYVMTLTSQEMYEALQNALGDQVTVKDLDAMISYSYLRAYNEKAGGVFSLEIKAPTQEMYALISKVITEKFESYAEKLNAGVIKHELLILSNSVEVNVDEELITEKYNLLTSIEKLESQRDSLEDTFSSAAKDIFAEWEATTYPSEEEVEEGGSSSIILILFVAIGMMLGVFLPVCYIVATYLLNGKVKTVRELNDYYGIHNLASIRDVSSKEWDSVASKLALACRHKEISQICLIKPENELCKEGIEYVVKTLTTKGVQVKVVENPAVDGIALEECNRVKNALLWVKLWHTKETDVVEILKTSKAYGFNVLGYVSEKA